MSELAELNKNHLRGCACYFCDMAPRPLYTGEEWENKNKDCLCRYCGHRGGSHAAAMNSYAGNCPLASIKRNADEKGLTFADNEKDVDFGWSAIYVYNPLE